MLFCCCSVVSDSLRPHGLQHVRLPCPSPTPGAYSNSCPSSQGCHLTISSSVGPFSSHLQSFQASGSFQMSQLSTSGGQSIGVSTSTSVPPMNTQDWSPLGWTWLDLLAVQGTLKSLLQHHSSKASILWCSAFFMAQLSHPYMTTEKTIALTINNLQNSLCSFVVAQSCPTLWDPTDCNTSGFPVHHHLPELAQIHVHWVSDTIQSSCPLLSPSPPAFNLPQH